MFIQRALAAIFACKLIKTLFKSSATANRSLMALIYTIEKYSILRLSSLFYFKSTFLVNFGIISTKVILQFACDKSKEQSDQSIITYLC